MKRLLSKILVLSMMVGMFSVPVSALTDAEITGYINDMYDEATTEANGGYTDAQKTMINDLRASDSDLLDKIDMFCIGVMSLENKDEFVNMLVLLRDVDNEEEFREVYKQMFNSLLSGQQARLSSFGATIDAASDFGNYFMNEGYSVSNLEDYLGLGGDATVKPKAFRMSLIRRADEFDDATDAADADDLEAGLSRIDMLFKMVHLSSTYGDGNYNLEFLSYDFENEVLILDEVKANQIIIAANVVLGNDIDSADEPIEGFKKLVDYINSDLVDSVSGEVILVGESDKVRILNYLGMYGFVLYPEPTVVTETRVITRTVTVTETVTDLGPDETTALAAFTFRDITPNFLWASTAIRQLTISGVILGRDEDTFDPAGLIDRAEFAALLTRMFEVKLPEDGPSNDADYESIFTDVLNPAWYVDEVHAAYVAGFVKGIGNGMYGPNQKITKEQIATMIARVLEDEGVTAPAPSQFESILSGFADADEVSTWAMGGSAMCADLNLIQGSEVDGELVFGFSSFATRAEVSVILYRLVEEGLIETSVEVFNPTTEEESLDL